MKTKEKKKGRNLLRRLEENFSKIRNLVRSSLRFFFVFKSKSHLRNALARTYTHAHARMLTLVWNRINQVKDKNSSTFSSINYPASFSIIFMLIKKSVFFEKIFLNFKIRFLPTTECCH